MSQFTPCTYCAHNSLLYRARNEGLKVTLVAEGQWIAAYAHPVDVEVPRGGFPEGSDERYLYWRQSYLVLRDDCSC